MQNITRYIFALKLSCKTIGWVLVITLMGEGERGVMAILWYACMQQSIVIQWMSEIRMSKNQKQFLPIGCMIKCLKSELKIVSCNLER